MRCSNNRVRPIFDILAVSVGFWRIQQELFPGKFKQWNDQIGL